MSETGILFICGECPIKRDKGGDSFQQKRVFTQLDVNILEGEENE